MAALPTITSRDEFVRVAKEGGVVKTAGVVVQFSALPHGSQKQDLCLGYTASRKVGGAVQRNKAKRRLRAATNAVVPSFGLSNMSLVFIAKPSTLTRPYERLIADLRYALHKVKESLA